MAKRIQVGGRIESKEVGGIVTGAAEILDDAKGKKQSVINGETDDELSRLDQSKQDNLTFDNAPTEGSDNPVKSGGLYTAQQAILLAIAAINELIPSAASVLNQLADKAFVNSSISTNTATFRGTSAAGLNEQQFLAWANGLTHDLNDYVFWQTSDAAGNTLFKRYKWNGTEWRYEYTLNNSTFTAEQWDAIQSGITALLVAKLRALPTAQELIQSFDSKQDALTFDDVPTLGSTNPVKSSGIYNVIKAITDLVPAEATAQNQLADKADVAAKIVAAIPSWKGQYDALTDLQAVTGAKAGDMGCVKTTDSDGHAVLTFYQYSAQGAWVVYYTLRHYAQNKPATTGTTGDYPYNGLGRIELQKNIVNGVNTLTQAMLTQQNTIYVIQYDFTLGEDITIPANCVLEFDGGSINGAYTLTGTNTGINAGLVKILNTNVALAGTWNVVEAYPEWFGAKGDGITDSTTAIQKTINTLNVTNITTIYLANKYLVSAPIIINSRRIVVKGSINRYEDFSLIVGDTFTPATIDGKVVKAVLALTKPIDIYNIGINGNKKANCIQWYDGWSAGVIENCQLAGGIGAGIAGFVTETLYIRNNFIHDCPIGVRISRFYFTVANDTDYSIFGIQSTNPNMGDFYCIEISGNVIECTGINIFLSHGCAVNIVNNLTAHSQIWGYYLYELHGVRIDGNYSEGEGVCAADGFTNVSGVDVLGATSQALIDNNLNGVALSATECVRAQSYMFDCHEVTISNTYLSYKKHSNKLVANEFDFDNTKAGIDSHVIWDYSDVLNIDNTRMFNWNADHISPYTGDECAIFDVAFKRMFPVLNIRHITDIPIFAMENEYYGPSVKLRIEHENMGNIVDMTANKWSTSLSYTPTAYTQSFAEMPVTLVKTLGAHKYYKFNSNAGAAHFSIDTPNIKRRSSKDYIQVMLPYINNSADDKLVIDTTTYNAGSNIGTMYFRDNFGKGMGVLIAILPIDMVCEHTDLCIRMFNGNGYDDMSFCVPTINYVGCEEIV